ncbi:MAG: hypothetical protein OXH72_07255 [Caldilineaceae bacterium]|nr:hypothetical protein [Caldilineaceae bacterium]
MSHSQDHRVGSWRSSIGRQRWEDERVACRVFIMVLPRQVTLISTFILSTRVCGWRDTVYPLIVPSFFAPSS